MNGLLDFISTPAGQGLLAAVAGGMAGANRGTPWNNAGRAGLAGLMGYSNAQNMAMKQEENAFQKQYREMQMAELQKKAAQQQAQQEWLKNNSPAALATGSALMGGGGPSPDNAAMLPKVDPRQQMLWEMAQQGILPMSEYVQATKPKDPKFQAFGAGIFNTADVGPDGMPKRVGKVEQETPFEYVTGPDGQVSMKPGILDAKRQIAQAGRATTNINMPTQEKEENKTVGKFYGEAFADIQKAGFGAQSKMNRYDRLGHLLQGVETGKFSEAGLEIAKAAQAIGFNVDPKVGNKEAAKALSNEIALELRNPSGGAGMPGALSDKDREFLVSMVPGLATTPEGRVELLATAKKLAQRDIEVAKKAREYRKKRGTIDEGFYDSLAEWSAQNPLFVQQTQQSGWSATRRP